MSKVKITGHASGSGTLTLTGPNTNSDRTITLPDATGTLLASEGAVTINEGSADVDFRVESDNDANALFVQGSDGAVGIGTATPSAKFEVEDGGTAVGNVLAKITIDDQSSHYAFAVGNDTYSTTDSNSFMIQPNNDGSVGFYNEGSLTLTLDGNRGLSQFTAKAWINFNGQSTIAIRDSHNVSSITDNGTGSYNVTMSNALGNVNYSVTATSGRSGGEDMHALIPETAYNQTTTQFRILTLQSWDTAHDASYVSAHVLGD